MQNTGGLAGCSYPQVFVLELSSQTRAYPEGMKHGRREDGPDWGSHDDVAESAEPQEFLGDLETERLLTSRRYGSQRARAHASSGLRSRTLLKETLEASPHHSPSSDQHLVRWKIPSGLIATVAVLLTLLTLWTTVKGALPGETETVSLALPSSTGSTSASSPSQHHAGLATQESLSPAPQESLTVHVDGAVAAPGVYTLPPDSRVNDAVQAAGGALPEAETGAVNLADKLSDGVKIYLPTPGEAPLQNETGLTDGGAATGQAPSAGANALVNINTATAEELQTLPKVGPVLASSIISWREEHGGFKSIEELDQVSGIGPATMENLRDLVTL